MSRGYFADLQGQSTLWGLPRSTRHWSSVGTVRLHLRLGIEKPTLDPEVERHLDLLSERLEADVPGRPFFEVGAGASTTVLLWCWLAWADL